RQRIGNVSGELWRSGEDGLRFSTTEAESNGMVIDESTGMPTSEERTSVFGGGLSFTTANNRLRGLAEMAWSRNTESEVLIERDSAGREQADLAWRARLDADLLKGDSHALTAWVYKRRIAPRYVVVHGDAPADR